MFNVHRGWESRSVGPVITELLRDAEIAGRYETVAKAIVISCFDQLRRSRKVELPLQETRYGIRIRDCVYYVVSRVDDEYLEMYQKFCRMRLQVTMLVPPWAYLAARTCAGMAEPRIPIQVRDLVEFARMRVGFSALDLDIPFEEGLRDLVWTCRRLLRSPRIHWPNSRCE